MQQNHQADKEFEQEYQHIKRDVKKVILINLLFLALLVALFFINQKTGFVNNLFPGQ